MYLLDDEKYSGHPRWVKEPVIPGGQLTCIRVTGGGNVMGARGPQWIIGVMNGGKDGMISRRFSSLERGEKPPKNGWIAAGFGGGGQAQPISLTWLESDGDDGGAAVPLDSTLDLEEWLEAVAPGYGAEVTHGCLALVFHMQYYDYLSKSICKDTCRVFCRALTVSRTEQGITTWQALVMACLPSGAETSLLEGLPTKPRKELQAAIKEGRAKFTEAWALCGDAQVPSADDSASPSSGNHSAQHVTCDM